jgi:hypothetical protein
MRGQRLRWGLLLGGLAVSFGWAQKTEKTPQLLIFMLGVPTPEKAEVGYSVNAGQFYSYMLPYPFHKNCQLIVSPDGRQHCQQGPMLDFGIEASLNRVPADRVRAVVFIPGCQAQLLDVAMRGRSEVHLDAKCVRVPIFKFRGRIADESVKDAKWLLVQVKYRANWAPKFLGAEQSGIDQPVPEAPQFDVVSVPMTKDKSFEIDLPILVHDPAEMSAVPEQQGELVFTLLNVNSKTPIVLGILRPSQFATDSDGLKLRVDYPEMQFSRQR